MAWEAQQVADMVTLHSPSFDIIKVRDAIDLAMYHHKLGDLPSKDARLTLKLAKKSAPLIAGLMLPENLEEIHKTLDALAKENHVRTLIVKKFLDTMAEHGRLDEYATKKNDIREDARLIQNIALAMKHGDGVLEGLGRMLVKGDAVKDLHHEFEVEAHATRLADLLHPHSRRFNKKQLVDKMRATLIASEMHADPRTQVGEAPAEAYEIHSLIHALKRAPKGFKLDLGEPKSYFTEKAINRAHDQARKAQGLRK